MREWDKDALIWPGEKFHKSLKHSILSISTMRNEKEKQKDKYSLKRTDFLIHCYLLMTTILTVKNMFKYFIEGKTFIQEWQRHEL